MTNDQNRTAVISHHYSNCRQKTGAFLTQMPSSIVWYFEFGSLEFI